MGLRRGQTVNFRVGLSGNEGLYVSICKYIYNHFYQSILVLFNIGQKGRLKEETAIPSSSEEGVSLLIHKF